MAYQIDIGGLEAGELALDLADFLLHFHQIRAGFLILHSSSLHNL